MRIKHDAPLVLCVIGEANPNRVSLLLGPVYGGLLDQSGGWSELEGLAFLPFVRQPTP